MILLEFFAQERYEEVFRAGMIEQETPLHIAVKNKFRQISELLRFLPQQYRVELLKMQDLSGKTALHLAYDNDPQNSSVTIKDLLRSLQNVTSVQHPEEKQGQNQLEVLQVCDINGQNILHYITSQLLLNIPLLKACLASVDRLPPNLLKDLLGLADRNSCTVFHHAATIVVDENVSENLLVVGLKAHNDALAELVKSFQGGNGNHLYEIVCIKNSQLQTALHHAVRCNFKSVQTLVDPLISCSSVSSIDLEELLAIQDVDGNTLLHLAAKLSELASVRYLCGVLDRISSRANILKLRNQEGKTVLQDRKSVV